MHLSILFCTYERPALIREALTSIAEVDGIGDVSFDVVVVDNSNAGTAAETIAEMARICPFPIRYVQAHPPNISVARNAAVAQATGDIVAFLDDDVKVTKGWLRAVMAGMETYDFDVMLGPVGVRCEVPELCTPHVMTMFDRRLPAPSGTRLHSLGPHRTRGFSLCTANAIFRRHVLMQDAVVFDPQLGDSGGEDVDFFARLDRRGVKMGYLAEAQASEFVPKHRCDIGYLEHRNYSGGQIFAFCSIKNSENPGWTALVFRVKALIQLAQFALTSWRMDADTRRIRKAQIFGKLRWKRMMPIYRMEDSALTKGAQPGAVTGSHG